MTLACHLLPQESSAGCQHLEGHQGRRGKHTEVRELSQRGCIHVHINTHSHQGLMSFLALALRPGRVYPSTALPFGGAWRQHLPHLLDLPCCVRRLHSHTLVPALTQVTRSSQNKARDLGHTYVWVSLGAGRNGDLSWDVHPPASSGLCSSWFQGDPLLLQAIYWATSNPGASCSPSS